MAPLPGVEGLPALVEQFRSAGADITLSVQGDTSGLPATTGLAVYRIAQEALTNAAKHAPGGPTAVRLTVGAGRLTLTADSLAEPSAASGSVAKPGSRRWAWSACASAPNRSAGPARRARAARAGWCGPRSRSTLRCGPSHEGKTVIRVLLVDDQELVRTGLRGILREPFGFDVVGECADGREVSARRCRRWPRTWS